MRITLDYYRILSVPTKADSQQLEQAYQDRLQQQSRREYSIYAIAAKKTLLKQAYEVLSNPQKRIEYDQSFFTSAPIEEKVLEHNQIEQVEKDNVVLFNPKTSPEITENSEDLWEDSVSPSQSQLIATIPQIEIEPKLLIGALMILFDLAEYEAIISLGNDYLYTEGNALKNQAKSSFVNDLPSKQNSSEKNEEAFDILLCLALSYLEISREQWRREDWEQAAISGQMGLNLLRNAEKSIFPALQAEIESELNLLKPYRVLDLLSKNAPGSNLRNKGIQILQEMLLQREGIAENCSDPFGLELDQFLYFIQQIRDYLTLPEQKKIFLKQAQQGSSSSTSSCVAGYALMAEGYAFKKPSLILDAQKIFQSVSNNQNPHWERAICALLLGQTNQSQEAIQQSKETETLELIKKHSQNSPDLLPGLCFYGEQWLQKEVLSQFKDLKYQKMTLKEYFGDRNVQSYLEKIAPTTPNQNLAANQSSPTLAEENSISPEQTRLQQLFPWWKKKQATQQTVSIPQLNSSQVQSPVLAGVGANNYQAATTVSHNSQSPNPKANPTRNATKTASHPNQRTATGSSSTIRKIKPNNQPPYPKRTKTRKKSSTKKVVRSGLILLGLICGLGTISYALTKNQLQKSSQPTPKESATKPPLTSNSSTANNNPANNSSTGNIPNSAATTKSTQTPSTGTETALKLPPTNTALTSESAQQVIQKWLDSKAAALGKGYQSSQLETVLTGSLLKQWSDSSVYYKQNNIYRQFEHTLKIRSVKPNPNNADSATVEAEVKETAQHYQGGQLNQQQSYSDNLLVKYDLIRQNNSWLIQNSQVLQSF